MPVFIPDNPSAALEEWAQMVGLDLPTYTRVRRRQFQWIVRCQFASFTKYGTSAWESGASKEAATKMLHKIYTEIRDKEAFCRFLIYFDKVSKSRQSDSYLSYRQRIEFPLASLSELCHARGWSEPRYNYLGNTRLSLCAFECKVEDYRTTGVGTNPHLSELNAARSMLQLLEEAEEEDSNYVPIQLNEMEASYNEMLTSFSSLSFSDSDSGDNAEELSNHQSPLTTAISNMCTCEIIINCIAFLVIIFCLGYICYLQLVDYIYKLF